MKLLLSLLLCASLSGCADWVSDDPQLLRESYDSDVTKLERDYFVYLPPGFSTRQAWPVLLFLHGNGERGDGKDELDFVLKKGFAKRYAALLKFVGTVPVDQIGATIKQLRSGSENSGRSLSKR